MPKKFQTVKGMRDFLPLDFKKYHYIIQKVRELFQVYNYQEINMPIVEDFELIAEKAGEEIRKTMYVFKDKADRTLALRPEMTASIARTYISNFMKAQPKPVKLGYIGQCYRYDNPQFGRYREFFQAGFEFIGSSNTISDVEIITICCDLMNNLNFEDFSIKLGHVGILSNILKQENIEEHQQNRIFGLIDKGEMEEVFNILIELKVSKNCSIILEKLFELKGRNLSNIIKQASKLLSNYSESMKSLENLKELIKFAEIYGISKYLDLNLGFARGLEYYTGMIFEIFIPKLDIAVGGGGRYDHLVETFGGNPTNAVGCALGIDRILLAMDQTKIFSNIVLGPDKILIIPFNEEMLPKAIEISRKFREKGKCIELEIVRDSLKKALQYADSQKFRYVIIVAPKEAKDNKFGIRDMKSGEQKTVSFKEALEILERSSS
ncbi:MAG: histidine--tRNA ligase [Candidatus Helarchaeota archaeon]|nr:histidine--tRNA ligase [Candidatus Helarchaeota archaeon]